MKSIVQTSNSFLGKSFKVELSGTGEQIWVRQCDLSWDYDKEAVVPKNAKARVNRAYYENQQKHFESTAEQEESPNDPVKCGKRAARWAVVAQVYHEEINKVLKLKPQLRPAAVQKLIHTLKPAKTVLKYLTTDRFLDGFTIWQDKNSVLRATEGKLGYMTCTICEKDFKWTACERAIRHVLSVQHHKCCRKKQNTNVHANSQRVMSEAVETATGLCPCINQIMILLCDCIITS